MEKETTKLEQALRNRLEERRMQPSENAWERVNLLRERRPERKKRSLPYGIAAVLVVAFGIFGMLRTISADIKPQEAVTVAEPAHATPLPARPVEPAAPQPQAPSSETARQETRIASAPKSTIKASSAPEPRRPEIHSGINGTTAGIQERKIQEITASVQLMAASGKEITDDDIDALIEKARRDIAAGKGPAQNTDASALLRDSEKELDGEFRTNVFKELIQHKRIRIAFGNP